MKSRAYKREFPLDGEVLNGKICGVCGSDFETVVSSVSKHRIDDKTVLCHVACTNIGLDKDSITIRKLSVPSKSFEGVEFSANVNTGAICYKCNFLIIAGNENTRVRVCNGGDFVSVHRKCIPNKCNVCGAGIIRITDHPVLDGDLVRHEDCRTPVCHICFKACANPMERMIINHDGMRVAIHTECFNQRVQKHGCSKCKTKDGNFVVVSAVPLLLIQHKDCVTDICPLCSKIIGPALWIDVGDSQLYHADCLKPIKCANCGIAGGDIIKTKEGFRHVKKTCTNEVCNLCDVVIGHLQFVKLNDFGSYHTDCLDKIKCYACGETGIGKKVVDSTKKEFSGKFIHAKCNSSKCVECNCYIGNLPLRMIDNKIYHGGDKPHGPICHVCRQFDSNDSHTLLNFGEGTKNIYRHVTCVIEECPICFQPLGKIMNQVTVFDNGKLATVDDLKIESESGFKRKRIQVHEKCVTKCGQCNDSYITYNTKSAAMFDPRISKQNAIIKLIGENWKLQYLSMDLLDIVMTSHLTLRRVAPGIVKQIIKKIIIIILSQIPNIEFMLPINRGCFNMLNICTTYRCSGNVFCMCGGLFSWNSNDKTRCRFDGTRCVAVTRGLREIMVACYKTPVYFTWPINEDAGIRSVTVAVLHASPQDTIFCNAKMQAIERFIAMRLK